MGRERKPQVGSSNFNATLAASFSGTIDTPLTPSSSRSPHKKTTLKPLTHKMISHPGEDGVEGSRILSKSPSKWKSHTIDTLSVWRGSKVFKLDYLTEAKTEFGNPLLRHGKNDEGPFKEAISDAEKKRLRDEAVQKLCDVANQRFGNTTNMMKAFKKRSGDFISYYEFTENLRQRAMDAAFPEEDLNLVFEEFDKKNEGIVPVDSLLQTAAKVENFIDKERLEEMLQIRNFLAEQLEINKKGATDNSTSGNGGSIGGKAAASVSSRSRGLLDRHPIDEKQEMKKALGQKTFGLDVDTQELQEVINNAFHKHHTIESHNKFARFLRLTNVNIDRIPFYPMRDEELKRLKEAAQRLEATASDPVFMNRYQEVGDRCRERLVQPALADKFAAGKPIDYTIDGSNHGPSSAPKQSPGKLPPMQPEENEAVSASGRDQLVASPTTSSYSPNSKRTPTAPVFFLDRNESYPADFTVAVSATKAMQNRGSGIFDFAKTGGASEDRMFSTSKSMSDLSRIGMTMAGVADDGTLDRQSSVSSSYFAPLIYEPSKEVARDTISDAHHSYQIKEARRIKRAERTAYNRQATTDRLEFESLNKKMKELRTAQYRNEDTIRYQTAIFLDDMKSFKKQPLELMAKRPNFNRSDYMFGGSLRSHDPDKRDFSSTYKSDYNDSALTSTLGSGGHGSNGGGH